MASISAILSSVIGSSSVFGEAWQLHPNQQIRWPPQGHGVLAPDSPTVAPARRSPTISTTSVDTNFVIDPQGTGHRYDPLHGNQTEDAFYSSASHLLFQPNEGDGAIFTQRAA